MCGLIGMVSIDAGEMASSGPVALCEEAITLKSASLEHLEERLPGFGEALDGFFGFGDFYAALEDDGWQSSLKRLTESLDELGSHCDVEQSDAHSADDQERWAAVGIRARDLAWHLAEDLLPNLSKVQKLGSVRQVMSRSRAFNLWNFNTLLNGIDRLEVRGRDSAGVVVQVFFSEESVLDGYLDCSEVQEKFRARQTQAHLTDGAVRRISRSNGGACGLLFAYKVAEEIGEMGENVAGLRTRISQDVLLHRALEVPGVRVSPLAHTRWASNGVISEPNCHPLDNEYTDSCTGEPISSDHSILAVLNGDIDNYQQLKDQLELERGRSIAGSVTTDAKIIPLWIDRYLDEGCGFLDAFRKAVGDFHGSMAIAVQTSLEPGKLFLAQRGSGQSIYIGLTPSGYLCASELYGLVEETRRFIKMDGERERIQGDPRSMGQIAVIDSGWQLEDGSFSLSLSYYDGVKVSDIEALVRTAEITTRDINRAGFPHFMLKEITESVTSVQKTIRGKFKLDEEFVRLMFVGDVLPDGIRERLRKGRIRRIYCIGQGTAAVAGQGVVVLMSQLLADAPVEVAAIKATELSGFLVRPSMEDTLVVAVSQSGTTTDTNRTIDLVRERGAFVIGIVNRRNSDLVYKSDTVFYTSDGRDVEMSVASTKAFYSQVTAGYLLSIALAQIFETLTDIQLREELHTISQLPSFIEKIIRASEPIRQLAEDHAVRHRHWAVVGNGASKVAADEIRIKLSELCYKAIACDFTEDKKHIDLSSEPLILVCAAGLSRSNLNDVVKEVAIFKAHKAQPLVVTDEGESSFDPYALGVMTVPRGAGRLAFVLTTVVGHLWGYYAARALDSQAQFLRQLRARSVVQFEKLREQPGGLSHDAVVMAVRSELAGDIRCCERWLATGALNSGLEASVAVRLSLALHAISGRLPFDDLVLAMGKSGTRPQLVQSYLATLTDAINGLTRPIDAIKHQAKTVTVGISRAVAPRGLVFNALKELGISPEWILPSHIESLQAISGVLDQVTGMVEYQLEGLTHAGGPGADTQIRVARKTGLVANIPSRADHGAPLLGTKWLISLERRLFVGVGSSDGRELVMFPVIRDGRMSGIVLLHVEFNKTAEVDARIAAVRNYRNRYEQLVGMVTERNLSWSDRRLKHIPVALLFEGSPEAVMTALNSAQIADVG